MENITAYDLHYGGEAEVALLNKLARLVYEELSLADKAGWICATGVQSSLEIIVEKISETGEITTLTLDDLSPLVQELRKVSKGDLGQPWFQVNLVVNHFGEPEVFYDWSIQPAVSPKDLLLDLALYPRSSRTLPEWYTV